MRSFYTSFFAAVRRSRAHAAFCERVFGANLCQHGFANMTQIEALLDATCLRTGDRVLDLGCGNGMISEYISDRTGAHVTGLDYIPEAIEQAQERTSAKSDRVAFVVGDINHLDGMPSAVFDAIISVDTMYFSHDYAVTIGELARMLRPGGQMAIFFSHGREPWVPVKQFRAETLPADRTPLAEALQANGLCFRTLDFTKEDYRLAQLRKVVLGELRPEFEAEGNAFIYDNRIGDAQGISQAFEEGLQARYLYHAFACNRDSSQAY